MQRWRRAGLTGRGVAALCYGVGFLWLPALPGAAELSWETRGVTLAASALDASVDFAFPFENTGASAVTVTSIRPSCGCTAAQLDEPTIEAGAGSAITGSFTIGDRRGKQAKTIVVRTDDPDRPVATLRLTVEITEAVEATPRLVFWRDSEAREPKTIEVTVHEPGVLALDGIEAIGDEAAATGFEIAWEAIPPEAELPETSEAEASAVLEDGADLEAAGSIQAYRVTVTPAADAGEQRVQLRLGFAEPLPEYFRAPVLMARTLGSPPPPEVPEAPEARESGEARANADAED